jgi:hypothetical protein
MDAVVKWIALWKERGAKGYLFCRGEKLKESGDASLTGDGKAASRLGGETGECNESVRLDGRMAS